MSIKKKTSVLEYKKHDVIVWGASKSGEFVKDYFEQQGIEIQAFVDSDQTKCGTCLGKYEVISPEQLRDRVSENKKILVQIASYYEKEIVMQLEKMNITDYVSYSDFLLLKKRNLFNLFKEDEEFYDYYLNYILPRTGESELLWDDYFEKMEESENMDSTIICCLPPKTGNYTVMEGLNNCKNSVLCVDTWHTSFHIPAFIHKVKTPVNKIITAVREPISQNISLLFQVASECLFDQQEFWENDYSKLLEKAFLIDSDLDIENSIYRKLTRDEHKTMFIQNFFEEQFKRRLGIDILSFPFDTQKGYSILKHNGVEIFIYQLEKFDPIQKELNSFVGIDPNIKFEKANAAENKYYYSLYQETKQTIHFSKKYFEDTFDNEYIKHFYSESDIEKFQKKWEGHVVLK